MYGIVGRWTAVGRQATFDVTPLRKVRSGEFADLVIQSDGSGYAEKKRLIGKAEITSLSWHYETGGYLISIPSTNMVLIATLSDGLLLTVWKSSIKSIDGMAVLYERV